MDFTTLQNELTTDPLGRGYAGMTDAQVASDMNLVNRPLDVPSRDVKVQSIRQGTWAGIVDAAGDSLHSGHTVALLTTELINDPTERGDIDFTDADVSAQMDALVAAGLLSAANRIELEALQNNRQSRAAELGVTERVSEGLIAHVRSL